MASRSTVHRQRRDAQLLLRLEERASLQHEIHRMTGSTATAPQPGSSGSASRHVPIVQALDDRIVNEALDLHFLLEEFESLSARFRPLVAQLVFFENSLPDRPVQPRPINLIATFNSGPLALDLRCAENVAFLEYEAYIFRTIGEVERGPPTYEPSREAYMKLVDSLYAEVERLELVKAKEWNRRWTTPAREDPRYIEMGKSHCLYLPQAAHDFLSRFRITFQLSLLHVWSGGTTASTMLQDHSPHISSDLWPRPATYALTSRSSAISRPAYSET